MNSQPTPYADLNAVLREFIVRLREVLRADLIGVYLHGSFALGDFDRDSDVDFIVAVEHDIEDAQLAALQSLHRDIFGFASPWAQHLEGSYIPVQAFRRLPPPQREFLFLG